MEINFVEVAEPHIDEVLASPQMKKWKRVSQEEIENLKDRRTWKVADLPPGKRCVKCRWTFSLKNSEGKISRFKARLMAQEEGNRLQ